MIREFPRRTFLNAVGALWGLSWTEQVELSNKKRDREETSNEDVSPDMHQCGDGLSWAYLDERRGHNGSISVAVDPRNKQSPIVIEGYLDRSRVAVGLEPDEAANVAEELVEAAKDVRTHRDAER